MSIKRADQPHDISWESLRGDRHKDRSVLDGLKAVDQTALQPIVPPELASDAPKPKAMPKTLDARERVTFSTRVFVPERGLSRAFDEIVRMHAEEAALRSLLRHALTEYPRAIRNKQGCIVATAYAQGTRSVAIRRTIDRSTYETARTHLDPYRILNATALAQLICHHALAIYLQRLDQESRDV